MNMLWAMLAAAVLLLSGSATVHADELPDIAMVFHRGDPFTIRTSYCQEEYQMAGLLKLMTALYNSAAWKRAEREWGKGKCTKYGTSYDSGEEKIRGTYVGYSSDPVTVDDMKYWIVEVEVDGESLFTYVIGPQVESLRKAQIEKMPAASGH